jgi:hypothetical protein
MSRNARLILMREALVDVMDNADEDTPEEYRSSHFKAALRDGRELVAKFDKEARDGKESKPKDD